MIGGIEFLSPVISLRAPERQGSRVRHDRTRVNARRACRHWPNE